MSRPSRHCLLLLAAVAVLPGSPARAQAPAGLSLAQVYRSLDSSNPRLRAARRMAAAADARVAPAGTLPDPRIQFGLMNRSLPGLGLSDPLGMTQIQVMQMIPVAGQLGLAGRAARAGSDAALARAADLALELRARAAMAFYELYQADRSLEIAEASRRLLRDIGTTARAMYAVGQGRQADVLRAQVEVDRMAEEVVRMQAMRREAAARLNALLDRPADASIETPVLPAFPDTLPAADSLQRLALLRRPMLAAGAREVDAARAMEQRARREIWPDLELGAAYGQRPMEGKTDRMLSVMVGFSVPLWAGRRQLEMRREAGAMREAAEAELAAMAAETRGRVAELAAALARSRELAALYRTTILPQAEATVTATLAAYRVGEVDLPMLLDARMAVNKYRMQVVQLTAEQGTALAELEMLVGAPLFDPDMAGGIR